MEDIEEIKDDIDYIYNACCEDNGLDVRVLPDIENGLINSTTFANQSSATKLRSVNNIKLNEGDVIYALSDNGVTCYYFDSETERGAGHSVKINDKAGFGIWTAGISSPHVITKAESEVYIGFTCNKVTDENGNYSSAILFDKDI